MDGWKWGVEMLREWGFSPSTIGLIVLISTLMYRSWKREETFQARQDSLHERIDEELARLSKEHEKCMKNLTEVQIANIRLDRWKAVCEDACPVAEDLHKARLPKWNGSN